MPLFGDFQTSRLAVRGILARSWKPQQDICDILDFRLRSPEYSDQTTLLIVRGVCQACHTFRGPGCRQLAFQLSSAHIVGPAQTGPVWPAEEILHAAPLCPHQGLLWCDWPSVAIQKLLGLLCKPIQQHWSLISPLCLFHAQDDSHVTAKSQYQFKISSWYNFCLKNRTAARVNSLRSKSGVGSVCSDIQGRVSHRTPPKVRTHHGSPSEGV